METGSVETTQQGISEKHYCKLHHVLSAMHVSWLRAPT